MYYLELLAETSSWLETVDDGTDQSGGYRYMYTVRVVRPPVPPPATLASTGKSIHVWISKKCCRMGERLRNQWQQLFQNPNGNKLLEKKVKDKKKKKI